MYGPPNPRLPGQIDALRRDETGGILVFVAVALAVMLGMVALSFDLGRMAITQTELQSFADSVALSAAGELDGNASAITRATTAAALIADTKTFGSGDATLQGAVDYQLTFLSALPASDTAATSAVTTNPRNAVYVRVDVNQSEVGLTIGAAFFALMGTPGIDTNVGARAVAGFTQYACDVTPLMFCLPNTGYRAESHVGEMIRLRASGQGASWGPGDFGFLDPAGVAIDPLGPCAGLSNQQLDRCLIGSVGGATQCYALRGVDTEPGQKVGIENALFNVRFDIFRTVMNNRSNNPNYAPAPNVIKGIVPRGNCNWANPDPSPNTVGLPRDTCFATNTCGGNGRFGNGNWTTGRTNYVNVNYGGTDPHPTAPTRYQYYLAEIAAHGGAGSATPILTGRAETGRRMCATTQSADTERRVVIAAGIDCGANPIAGRTRGVPVQQFFRLFLTEPVGADAGNPSAIDLWAEIVGPASVDGTGVGNTGGIIRDVVQLYR